MSDISDGTQHVQRDGGRMGVAGKIMGVCSSGGHLIQMEALSRMGFPIDYILTPSQPKVDTTHVLIPDCNIRAPLRTLRCTLNIAKEVIRLRPSIIISTGAAPGGIALVVGSLLGCKTVWIDSIANAERASLTGRMVRPFATLWLSQWKSVAEQGKGIYIGKIFNFFDGGDAASI